MTMREFDALLKRERRRQEEALYLACLTGGLAASASYNATGATKQDGGFFTPADFLPTHKEQTPEQTPEQMLAIVKLMNAAFGGERTVHDGV